MKMLAPATAQLPDVRDKLEQMLDTLPPGEPDSVRVIGANRLLTSQVDRSELTYATHSKGGRGVVVVVVAEELGMRYVESARVFRIKKPIEELNTFGLFGRGVQGVLLIVAMVIVVGFCLWVAVLCMRTPTLSLRWLWALFAIFAVGRIAMNWSTGEVQTEMVRLQFFGAGLMRAGLYGPWILSLSFPLGALVSWGAARGARADQRRAAAADVPAEATADPSGVKANSVREYAPEKPPAPRA